MVLEQPSSWRLLKKKQLAVGSWTEGSESDVSKDAKNNLRELEIGETNKQTNSVALARDRTIPTERPPLVDEVSVNLGRK
jgi:hypothetical protein